jgi:hypothetical protein
MVAKINWSDESRRTYDENISYLLNTWTEREVKRFVQQTEFIISRLQEQPESFNPSLKNKRIRRARLNKYTTLYYRYYPTRGEILLLSFWNVKQDPKKLKY